MIYLIKSVCILDKEKGLDLDNLRLALKIGFTDDANSVTRFNSYTTHNKAFSVLDTISGGTLEIETALHRKFRKYLIETEWFEYRDEIIDFFRDNHSEEALIKSLDIQSSDIIKKAISKSLHSLDSIFSVFVQRISKKCCGVSCRLLSRGTVEDIYRSGTLSDVSSIKTYLLDKYGSTVEEFEEYKSKLEGDTDLLSYFNEFNSYGQFIDKMRFVCNHPSIIDVVPQDFKNFYETLGPEKCRALGYRLGDLKSTLESMVVKQDDVLESKIKETFKVGERYTKSSIKSTLKSIYEDSGCKSTPKATELLRWFSITECKVVNKETGTREPGFLIMKEL